MEIKSATIFIFLILILPLSFSTGGLDSEIYEIDYRGPETHSSIPPPDHSHGRRPFIHHKTARRSPKPNSLTPANLPTNGKKNIHG
ncbi:uncharacterized protein LOC110825221 [Carica papaya]|uniref:uncharacterized protein LOC110825221 n=1 Tax=Carica papaya TaxID=3649 RepID=UPI000B8CC07B|nr:uncharacterized protein LOC110825221 [Carica papaya]